MLAVSAVIPSWNRKALLERLLSGLFAQTYAPVEVIVVDNGSTDGAPEAAESAGARVVRLGENQGFAPAVNRGIAESKGEAIAILNNDVELDPQCLERLASALDDRAIRFACGKLVLASNPAILDGTFDLVSRAMCPWRAGWGRAADSPFFNEPRTIAIAPMTASLFRADLFRDVGLLDESFESYLEDVDFGLRCAARGFSGRYVPSAMGRHLGSATLGRWHSGSVRRMARNMAWLVDKHLSPELRLRWKGPIRAGQLAWGLVALRHGAFGAWRQGRRLAAQSPRAYEGSGEIAGFLEQSERQLIELQRSTGWDAYWRLYHALAGEL